MKDGAEEIKVPDDDQEEKEEDDLDEYFRREIDLMNEWEEEVEKKILPQQYWSNAQTTAFKTTEYTMCYDDQPYEEYNQLCYLVKLGQGAKALKIAEDLNIKARTVLRKNGDTILHVCAEYGAHTLFTRFKEIFNCGELDIRNSLDETPFITAAREGRLNVIKLFFERYKGQFDPDSKTKDGWTAFFYACLNGYINTIQFLAA